MPRKKPGSPIVASPNLIGIGVIMLLVLQLIGLPSILLGSVRAESAGTRWFSFDPEAIRNDAVDAVEFRIKIDGSPSDVQFRLATGDSLRLINLGSGIWSASLSASQVLFGYQAENANHNFVGFVDVYEGSERVQRLNAFTNVLDHSVPDVRVTTIGPTVKMTCHAFNIWRPGLNTESSLDSQVATITQEFYDNFGDDFDFINVVFALPSFRENRHHFEVQNNVEGIGLLSFNTAGSYGSAGRLQGITIFPIDTLFDMAETAAIHELGHQWINFLHLPVLARGFPHWPISSLARGVMGFSIPPTREGGAFPFNLVPLPDGSYKLEMTEPLREFTDLDLYLMGLLTADQVGSHIVFVNQDQADQLHNGGVLSGPVETVTVDDVIGSEGPRAPNASEAQKTFKLATVIVTKERLLTADEMALFDHFAARAEATEPLQFSSGFEKGTTKPFFVATLGKGSLISRIPGGDCQGTPETVGIDIGPGKAPYPVNLRSRAKIPVAILSSHRFDAPREVDIDSLRFGRTGDEPSLVFCGESRFDVNADGLLDLVCRFDTRAAAFATGDTEGILRGQLKDGTRIEGRGPVRLVPGL